MHQTIDDDRVDLSDHVWYFTAGVYKCCSCGAITKTKPPRFPTDPAWMPEHYDPLDDGDRQLVKKWK